MSIAVDELAKQLYVDPGDVRVIPATLTDEPMWAERAPAARRARPATA